MSPYSCPDMISDVDLEESFISFNYKPNDIDPYTQSVLDFSDKIEIKLRLKRDNKHKRILGYSDGRINYKKSIKFWSRVRSNCKKELKRLRNKIFNKTYFNKATKEDYMLYITYDRLYLNAEDMMHQARFYRKDKYQTYMIPVKLS